MAKRILFLDDNLERHRAFLSASTLLHDAAYTAEQAIAWLRARQYDVVFLDHDLGGREETGYTVAKWIAERAPVIPLVVVHSMNPVGAGNIASLLRGHGYTVVESPFRLLESDMQWILDWKPDAA